MKPEACTFEARSSSNFSSLEDFKLTFSLSGFQLPPVVRVDPTSLQPGRRRRHPVSNPGRRHPLDLLRLSRQPSRGPSQPVAPAPVQESDRATQA